MNQILETAAAALTTKYRCSLSHPSAATVTFPDFDPALARQVVAIVKWPASVYLGNASVPLTLTHTIQDGDTLAR